MTILQLSVFLENREGTLEEVTALLAEHKINITTLSLADTTDYGMLRLIVSEPEKGKSVLKEAGFSAMLTEVIAVKLPHEIGMLNRLLKTIVKEDISIEYMYVLATGDNPSMILKLSDMKKGLEILLRDGFKLINDKEAYYINS